MTTRATLNYIAIFQDITENYASMQEIIEKCHVIDEIAEKCLTSSEQMEYLKSTIKIFKEMQENLAIK